MIACARPDVFLSSFCRQVPARALHKFSISGGAWYDSVTAHIDAAELHPCLQPGGPSVFLHAHRHACARVRVYERGFCEDVKNMVKLRPLGDHVIRRPACTAGAGETWNAFMHSCLQTAVRQTDRQRDMNVYIPCQGHIRRAVHACIHRYTTRCNCRWLMQQPTCTSRPLPPARRSCVCVSECLVCGRHAYSL